MAVINQSPTGQASVALSGISFNDIAASATPFWQSEKIVGTPSVSVSFGDSVSAPTSGQIWPLGLL